MAKAQTDIRTTSYDALTANPDGYHGTIDEVISQIRTSPFNFYSGPSVRSELLRYLGVDKVPSAGPSVELDTEVRYGADPKQQLDVLDPGFFSVAHAKSRGWI